MSNVVYLALDNTSDSAEEPYINASAPDHGGGNGGGGSMETWQASVDRRLDRAEGDIRTLLGRGIAAVVALAFLVAGLYLYVGQKDDGLSQRLSAVEATAARLDERTIAMDKKLDAADKKADVMDDKLDKLLTK